MRRIETLAKVVGPGKVGNQIGQGKVGNQIGQGKVGNQIGQGKVVREQIGQEIRNRLEVLKRAVQPKRSHRRHAQLARMGYLDYPQR